MRAIIDPSHVLRTYPRGPIKATGVKAAAMVVSKAAARIDRLLLLLTLRIFGWLFVCGGWVFGLLVVFAKLNRASGTVTDDDGLRQRLVAETMTSDPLSFVFFFCKLLHSPTIQSLPSHTQHNRGWVLAAALAPPSPPPPRSAFGYRDRSMPPPAQPSPRPPPSRGRMPPPSPALLLLLLLAAALVVAAAGDSDHDGKARSPSPRRVFVTNGLLGLAFAIYLSSRGLRKGSLSRSGAMAVRGWELVEGVPCFLFGCGSD